MNYRDHTFELSGSELELELQWSYYYNAGRYSGLPENCFPEEEECEVCPPIDIAARVKAHADKMCAIWIKEIESQCMDMELDNAPAEWAADDRQSYEESRAEAQYEAMREAKYGY